MIYQWKLPGVIPVDAQTAGDELERIYDERGDLSPAAIVDESRPESAPLHPCFEWNDALAAEKYREAQAQHIVRSIVAVCERGDAEPIEARAFVAVGDGGGYKPISVVINTPEQYDALLGTALRELEAFRRKYSALERLRPVFSAIDSLTA